MQAPRRREERVAMPTSAAVLRAASSFKLRSPFKNHASRVLEDDVVNAAGAQLAFPLFGCSIRESRRSMTTSWAALRKGGRRQVASR
jgi:hypothetical protein